MARLPTAPDARYLNGDCGESAIAAKSRSACPTTCGRWAPRCQQLRTRAKVHRRRAEGARSGRITSLCCACMRARHLARHPHGDREAYHVFLPNNLLSAASTAYFDRLRGRTRLRSLLGDGLLGRVECKSFAHSARREEQLLFVSDTARESCGAGWTSGRQLHCYHKYHERINIEHIGC